MAWSFGLLKNLRDFIQAYFQFGSIQPSDMTWHRGIWKTMAWSYKLFQNLRNILGGKKNQENNYFNCHWVLLFTFQFEKLQNY